MTVLRWGILGPGRIAPRAVRAIDADARGSLLAVASRDRARAQAFAATHGAERVYASYDELLGDADVDVVYVALPNHLHVPWTIRALRAGKHVLCEKPLALRPEDVDEVARVADGTGRIAVEAFMYLHHPQIRRALELAQAGDLGELRLMHGSFSFFLDRPDDPRADPAMGGGSIWDVGCYPVSFAHRLFGPDVVLASGFARYDERGIDRTFAGQLVFAKGGIAQFDSGFAAPDRQRLEIVGTDATLVMEAPFLSSPDGPRPSLVRRRGDASEPIDVPAVDQYALEVADLSGAILDGTTPCLTLAQSRAHIATLARLDALAREADAVTLVGSGTPPAP